MVNNGNDMFSSLLGFLLFMGYFSGLRSFGVIIIVGEWVISNVNDFVIGYIFGLIGGVRFWVCIFFVFYCFFDVLLICVV